MDASAAYPGQRLGLPAEGPGSVASFPRRLVAVFVDWILCLLIAYGVFDVPWGAGGAAGLVPLGLFAVENLLLVSTLGTTVGHRLLGLQVMRSTPGGPQAPPGLMAGLVRTVLLCLFVPALIPDSDSRGFHDKAAGTVIVRTR